MPMKPPAKDGNAGQVVCQPVVKEQFHRPMYLSDYIEKVQKEEFPKKKLTFDEWFLKEWPNTFQDRYYTEVVTRKAWNAAQENV